MISLDLDDAEHTLRQLSGTFFSSAAAAKRLEIDECDTAALLAEMENEAQSARVCRDGWVLTWHHGRERRLPVLSAYLHDMMQYLDVDYYLSYAAAAQQRGASHHGVMRQRVNVVAEDMRRLELKSADGPDDLAVSFHQIDLRHGRPVSLIRVLCLPRTGDGNARSQRRTIRVATAETAVLDMVEHPERCSGMNHVATITRKMLYWRLLHPALLAEASEAYDAQVARRTGSMLQQLRGVGHRVYLRPLARHASRRKIQNPVEMHSAKPDRARKADRWGVTYEHPLEPDV